MINEHHWPLKLKYLTPGRLAKRSGVDPYEGTWVYTLGLSSKIGKKGGNSGGVGKAGKRHERWPEGIKQRRRAS